MPYLPTQPLLPWLKGAIDQRLMGRGGLESGAVGVTFELARVSGYTYKAAERQLHRILSGSIHQINDRTADAIASALGMTPIEIWDNWYEVTTRKLAGWAVEVGLLRRPRFGHASPALGELRSMRGTAPQVLRAQAQRQAVRTAPARGPARVSHARGPLEGRGSERAAEDLAG